MTINIKQHYNGTIQSQVTVFGTLASSATLTGVVLGVLQHLGPQFWGPRINGYGKLLCAVQLKLDVACNS